MATSNGATIKQMLQDRRVQIALGVFALLAVAAVLFLTVFSGGDTTTASNQGIAGPEGYPGGYPASAGGYPSAVGGYPGSTSGYPGAVGGYPGSAAGYPGAVSGYPGAGLPTGAPPVGSLNTSTASKKPTSFDRPQGGTAATARIANDPFGNAGQAGGAAMAGPKPLPIVEGRRAPAARLDPFFTLFPIPKPQPPPAYLFTAPIRLASVRLAAPPTPGPGIDVRPPLPYIPRRVSGILIDGTTSAILETGNPGADAQVDVVQPGSRVDSGIPGVPQLTVESITPTQLTLRAPDGRRATVKLSALPPGALNGGGFVGGGYPGGGGGYPGVGGGNPGGIGGAPVD